MIQAERFHVVLGPTVRSSLLLMWSREGSRDLSLWAGSPLVHDTGRDSMWSSDRREGSRDLSLWAGSPLVHDTGREIPCGPRTDGAQ
ncbi:hypothetical protein J6590_077807 [Homalodisca vitripennis]|nr:hypothetical protein J6590_077807 [Homalodisca vitripennis]